MTDIYVGAEALPRLLAYWAERSLSRFRLVADQGTFAAWGKDAAQALTT